MDAITWASITTVLGIVLPPFTGFIRRTPYAKRTQDLIVLVGLVVIGGVAGFLVGDIDLAACSGAEMIECAQIIVAYAGGTLAHALVWWKMYWEESAVVSRAAGR